MKIANFPFFLGASVHPALPAAAKAPRRFPTALIARILPASILLLSSSSVAVAQQFQDVSSRVGLIAEAKKSWGNPIWGDMNNDGFLDLIVPCHGLSVSKGPFVYLNNAGRTFTDIRATCGINQAPELDSTDWHGFSFGDYDADGNLDLYVSEGAKHGTELKRDLLFRGRGNGVFNYVSGLAGIEISFNRGRCGFWFDYDKDGKLDLFVKNFEGANRLYRNKGDGTFTPVPNAARLAHASLGADKGFICSFADYDNDGFMDVAFSGVASTEALYRNQGDGTFREVTSAAGLKPRAPCQGVAWGDYNNDGRLDLYVARGTQGTGPFGNTLYRNNRDGTFSDVTQSAGVAATTNTWTAVWGDYDNDGFLDLFVTCAGADDLGPGNANLLYHNNGDGTFTNRADEEGLALQDNTSPHKGAAWADYDNDGFLDLIVKDGIGSGTTPPGAGFHRLFKNRGSSNHFIKVDLAGVQSNSHGIGARVTVRYAGARSFRQNNGGGGGEWDSQGSEPLHFGIGSATRAAVKVAWPSGLVDVVPSVTADSTLKVVEGSTAAPRSKTTPPSVTQR